jgi:hypothetical protein
VSTNRLAMCWSNWTRAISGRPKSMRSLAIRARRAPSSAGDTRRALTSWWRRWCKRTWLRSDTSGNAVIATVEGAVLRKVDVTLAKIFDLAGKRIYVTGHRGMVGSAIVRRLATCGCDESRPDVGLRCGIKALTGGPMTTSGKVQRSQARMLWRNDSLDLRIRQPMSIASSTAHS